VRLQEIAVAHARAGRAVLFTCFNKVLASTLRGILATQEMGQEVDRRVVVTHVDELRRQLDQSDLQAFAGLFGTICVDEAQDMSQASFELLSALVSEKGEWFLADGPGQELYGPAAPFLERARDVGTTENLRRNFRNTSAGFLVAQADYEHAPDLTRNAPWLRTRPITVTRDSSVPGLDLNLPDTRPGGELPDVVRLGVPHGAGWRQAKLHGYAAVFMRELEKLESEGRHRDLAILCARGDARSAEPQIAREALDLIGIPVHDQVHPSSRGQSVPRDHVRLTTIHSSRGVEASRVVILDLAGGLSQHDDHRTNSRIMAYIALSRGQHGTTIVALDDAHSAYLDFIEGIVTAYRDA
jgi:hypothetical protein